MKEGSKIQFVDSAHVKAHANRHKNQKVKIKKKVKSYQRKLEKYKPEKIVMDAWYKIPAITKELIDKLDNNGG